MDTCAPMKKIFLEKEACVTKFQISLPRLHSLTSEQAQEWHAQSHIE